MTSYPIPAVDSFLSRNSHPLHTKTYAAKKLLEIPLWIFLRSLITLLATNRIFFRFKKNRVEVKVKFFIFRLNRLTWQHWNYVAQIVSKKLKNDTKITFLAMIRAEIQVIKGTWSSGSGQTFMTHISESTWPKIKKFRVFTYLIGYNKCTKFRENLSRSCQSLWLNWHGMTLIYYNTLGILIVERRKIHLLILI